MKKLLWVVVLLAIALALPVSNLFITRKPDPALRTNVKDARLEKVVSIFEQKCLDCHSDKAVLPFYANLPVVSSMIAADIKRGTELLNVPQECFGPTPATEAVLAKIQRVVENGSMPPSDYRLMHWGSGINGDDKAALMAWIRDARGKANGAADGSDPIYASPVLPLAEPKGLNPDKVALGRKLYHDTRLSGDNTLSCASCHDLKKGGTDQAQFSTGIKGQKGGINAPTVLNAVHAFVQFWDGRATDLQAQAAGPVANPVEMGANWDDVPGKLKQDKECVDAFAKLYPAGITKASITDAIATFEKSLVTVNSRFDQFLRGKTSALTADEQEGYRLFMADGCYKCHVGQAIGGKSFEKFSLHGDYFADRGNPTPADDGRFSVTKNEADRHKFKVPSLRNITLTFPYLHDGSTSDLAKVVKLMGKYQLHSDLPDSDVALAVKFLGTLTGDLDGKPLK
ncbi:MAG: heme-binding domain-containing protein [Verrucomicrobia bacterium]|nr:heme-binding domain-containing protein [Verrucomicrobiota bacterium]